MWTCGIGEKWIPAAVKGREPWSQRRARERGAHGNAQGEYILKSRLAWKMIGAYFCEFLQPVEHKAWSFKKIYGLGAHCTVPR